MRRRAARVAVHLVVAGAPWFPTTLLAALTARLATLRHFLETLAVVELLFSGGEGEGLVTVYALEDAILELHDILRNRGAVDWTWGEGSDAGARRLESGGARRKAQSGSY